MNGGDSTRTDGTPRAVLTLPVSGVLRQIQMDFREVLAVAVQEVRVINFGLDQWL
jgi:hypothetical protein